MVLRNDEASPSSLSTGDASGGTVLVPGAMPEDAWGR
jgi:hypothetical protein